MFTNTNRNKTTERIILPLCIYCTLKYSTCSMALALYGRDLKSANKKSKCIKFPLITENKLYNDFFFEIKKSN